MKKLITFLLLLISSVTFGQISNRLFGPQNFLQSISANNYVYTIPPNDNRFFVASMDALRLQTYNILGINDTIRAIGDIRYKPIGYTPTVLEITTALGFTPLSVETDPIWSGVAMNYRTKLQNDLLYQPIGSYVTTETDPTVPAYAKTLNAFSVIKTDTDALYSLLGHTHTFASLTSKPTTLAGYGITDAYPLTGNPSGFLINAVTSIGLTSSDITVGGSSPITNIGTFTLTLPNINSNIGTFNNVTINAKGQATAASNVAYLTGNQTITLSGDITGSGATSITTTLASVGTAGTYGIVTTDAKGRVISGKRTETYSGTTITAGTYTVTFGTPYSVAPNIQANIINGTDTQNIRTTSITTTGFVVLVRNRVDVIGLLPSWTNVSGANVDVLITEK